MRLQGGIFDLRGAILDQGGDPLPGLFPFLSMMKMEGVQLCLLSEEKRRSVQPVLEREGLTSYFRSVLYAEEQGRAVTDPEMLEKAVRRLDTARPATVVFTGREEVLRSAQKAGFQVVLVGSSHSEELRTLADEVVNSYEDMTKQIF